MGVAYKIGDARILNFTEIKYLSVLCYNQRSNTCADIRNVFIMNIRTIQKKLFCDKTYDSLDMSNSEGGRGLTKAKCPEMHINCATWALETSRQPQRIITTNDYRENFLIKITLETRSFDSSSLYLSNCF